MWYEITSTTVNDLIHIAVLLSQSWTCQFKVYNTEISCHSADIWNHVVPYVTLKGVCTDGLSGGCQVEALSLWCYLLGDRISLQIIYVII